jgi:hypothetical protein
MWNDECFTTNLNGLHGLHELAMLNDEWGMTPCLRPPPVAGFTTWWRTAPNGELFYGPWTIGHYQLSIIHY